MEEDKKTLKSQVLLYISAGVTLSALYGMFTNFMPSSIHVEYTQVFSISFSLVLLVVAYVAFFKKESKWRAALKGKQKTWITTLVIPLPVFLMPYLAFTVGMPALLHEFVASEGNDSFLVESINSSYHDSKCTGGVNVDYGVFMKDEICGIPREIWNAISVGDTLQLIGMKSTFGLSYDHVRLIKNNEQG